MLEKTTKKFQINSVGRSGDCSNLGEQNEFCREKNMQKYEKDVFDQSVTQSAGKKKS